MANSKKPKLKPAFVVLTLSAFDIARYGRDELYNMVDEQYAIQDIYVEVSEMEMKPFKIINKEEVSYKCYPTDYKFEEL